MKMFKNKGISKIIRIAVYFIALAAVNFMVANSSHFTDNLSLVRFLIILEYALMILIVFELISFIKAYIAPLLRGAKKFLSGVFEPIRNKLRERYNRKQKFLKGVDESKLIFNFNIIDKLKNKLKLRQKLNFNHSTSNIEKIRLLYIKLVLTLIEKDYEIRYSHTPREIKSNTNCGEGDVLFDVYEQARYGDIDSLVISDDMIKSCEDSLIDVK